MKMSIGGFRSRGFRGFAELAQALRVAGIELLIENDQTVAAGTLPALQDSSPRPRAPACPWA